MLFSVKFHYGIKHSFLLCEGGGGSGIWRYILPFGEKLSELVQYYRIDWFYLLLVEKKPL
jgi:hypothetical protein